MQTRRKKHRLLMFCTLIAALVYIGWRIFYTLPFKYGLVSTIAGLALVIAESVGVLEAIEHYLNMSSSVMPKMPEIPNDEYPDVDVLIATHNEDEKLLYKTINACTYMDYPDKSKVHIFLCDDNDRPEMAALAKKLKVGYFGLSNNKFAKAGNLNNALRKTSSPLVATFDADMIPTSNFLMETVPYFLLPLYKEEDGKWVKREKPSNEKIGFIQTPQSFYNPDMFQYNLYMEKNVPNEQDYFFREINIGRNRTNSAIYAGSNTLLSRAALEDVGYIVEGVITEDFATGIEIQKKGYLCYAIDKTLAHGLAPIDLIGLIKQRERWGRGCVQTMKKVSLFSSSLRFKTKISYMSALLYWWTFLRRFIYIGSPILFTVFGVRIVECELWQLAAFWLPYYLLYNRSLNVLSGKIRTQRWSNIVDTIIFPYMIVPIFLESIGVKKSKFYVTNKNYDVKSTSDFVFATPHILLLGASVVGLIFSFRQVNISGILPNLILVFWLSVNFYFLIMALLFMSGRVNFRHDERLSVSLPITIEVGHKNAIKAYTVDVSEHGMKICIDFPEFVPYDQNAIVNLETDKYKAKVPIIVRHVRQTGHKWYYSVQISDEISEEDRRNYLQMVFDRHHTLPVVISSNWLKDVTINFSLRQSPKHASNRRLPRVTINKKVEVVNSGMVEMIDFNYEYIKLANTSVLLDKILVKFDNGLLLSCVLKDEKNNIYHVENWQKHASNPLMHQQLSVWLKVDDHQPVTA